MPNLTPPITTVEMALDYRSKLQVLEPNVTFLMSLFLHESMTVDTIKDAKRAGITGVKSYPAGVTTNSSSGVVDYSSYYPIFGQMEKEELVLNLHGECPSTGDCTILNAESKFLATLKVSAFPSDSIISAYHLGGPKTLEQHKSTWQEIMFTI